MAIIGLHKWSVKRSEDSENSGNLEMDIEWQF